MKNECAELFWLEYDQKTNQLIANKTVIIHTFLKGTIREYMNIHKLGG